MCGISGALFRRNSAFDAKTAVEATLGALRHRGPDGEGIVAIDLPSATGALGSTRLAIIDLSPAGSMPMSDARTGNIIVYNGEVYNFRELRKQLEALGEHFTSLTDTEVVLKAYGRWGPHCVDRFRGMYAFAIWDAQRRELFLTRDPVGKKPLYYAQRPDGVLFASELRALLATGCCDRRLDTAALSDFLFNGFCIAPRTPVQGIRSLLPGDRAFISEDGILLRIDHSLESDGMEGDRDGPLPSIEELVACFDESVRLRLVSDVPLGAFLSGGLDSTAVVAAMVRHAADVRTFSIGFEEKQYDEADYAREVARRHNTRHHELRLGKEQFLSWLPDGLAAMDLPTFDGLNSYCVARAAKAEGLTVALSGIGGDELFGGYPFFRTVPWLSRLARLVNGLRLKRSTGLGILRPELRHLSGAWKLLDLFDLDCRENRLIAAYQVAQMHFPSWIRARMQLRDEPAIGEDRIGLPEEFSSFVSSELARTDDPVAGISALAARLFLGERCLRDTDQMSMAVSLEVRAPLTDRTFCRLVRRIPGSKRCAQPPDKPFERALLQALLGHEIPRRPKQGFSFPFDLWLRDRAVYGRLVGIMGDRKLVSNSGLNFDVIQDLLRCFESNGEGIRWSRIWSIFVITSWCDRNRVAL